MTNWNRKTIKENFQEKPNKVEVGNWKMMKKIRMEGLQQHFFCERHFQPYFLVTKNVNLISIKKSGSFLISYHDSFMQLQLHSIPPHHSFK